MVALPESGRRRRQGFTLIELIVVITLILVLAAIAVMFVPQLQSQDQAGLGARQLMGWLQMARTRAMRDQRVRGLRFLPTAASATQVAQVQFIEQPDVFTSGTLVGVLGAFPESSIINPNTGLPLTPNIGLLANYNQSSWVAFANVDFFGGFGSADPTLWPVQPGDYLEVNGGGLMWRIAPPTANDPTGKSGFVPNTGLQTCSTLNIEMVNTITFPQPPLGPGQYRVHNAANLVAGMSVTIGTGDNEQVAQVASVAGTTVTLAIAGTPPPPPFPIRNNPPFPVASLVNATSQPLKLKGAPQVLPLPQGYFGQFQLSNAPGNLQGILAGSSVILTDAGSEQVTIAAVNGDILTVDYAMSSHPTPVKNGQQFTVTSPAVSLPYRIVRVPRLSGEDAMQLPVNVAIDLNGARDLTGTYNPPINLPDQPYYLAGAPFDLLFAPSGAVVGPLAGFDKILLWVRDVTQPNTTDNEPVLVCIYTRSGAIVPHKVDPQGGNNVTSYFTFTVDGRPSEGQ